MPCWTERAARRIAALRAEAQIASFVDERLDGYAKFRGVKGAALDVASRVLAVVAQWAWLQTAPARPADAAL